MIIKKYKEIIISVIIIAIIVCGYSIKYVVDNKHSKNIENNEVLSQEENEEIVTIDNKDIDEEEMRLCMQKGERFLKLRDIAIFANDYDECIYIFNLKNKNIKKLYKTENGIEKMYFDGEFVYILPYYYRGKGIKKIELKGNSSKIYEGSSIQLWLKDDKIYFVEQIGYDQINGTPQGNLSVMNKDGSDKKVLIENVKNYFYIVNDNIYYIDQSSRSIYCSKIDGTERKEIAKGRNYITSANENYLTYLDYSDGEKHHVIFLNNETNKEVGRFGNVYCLLNEGYIYTRKTLGNNSNIEDEYTLYKINYSDNTLDSIWKNEVPLEFLSYIYKNYAYFRGGSEFYRVNLQDGKSKEKIDIGYSYFINGKAYSIKSNEGIITELEILNLDDMKKETIK